MSRLRFLIIAACFAFGVACDSPSEGERCNPLLFNDECPSGDHCVYPTNCAVAYCCPASPSSTTSANCNACPTDGGTDGSATD